MSRDINLLHPRLQVVVKQLQSEFSTLLVTDAFRSVEEQDALYAKGRTKPGSIVTNVTGSSYGSQHQWGIAFDFANNEKGNLYPERFMLDVSNRAKNLGLSWGGDWQNFVDKPHLYLSDWGDDTNKLKKQYGDFDNFKKTWEYEHQQQKDEVEKMRVWRIFRNITEDRLFWFDGCHLHALTHPDQVAILDKISEEELGYPVKRFESSADAPWDLRLKEACLLESMDTSTSERLSAIEQGLKI